MSLTQEKIDEMRALIGANHLGGWATAEQEKAHALRANAMAVYLGLVAIADAIREKK